METLTKAKAQAISDDINKAIADVLAKHNMETLSVKTSYGDYYAFTLKASEVKLNDKGVNMASPSAQAWLQFGKSIYNVENPEALLGAEFKASGKVFKFTGVNLNATKMPFEATCLNDGKSYKFTNKVLEALKVSA